VQTQRWGFLRTGNERNPRIDYLCLLPISVHCSTPTLRLQWPQWRVTMLNNSDNEILTSFSTVLSMPKLTFMECSRKWWKCSSRCTKHKLIRVWREWSIRTPKTVPQFCNALPRWLIRNSKLWTSNCSEQSNCRTYKQSPFYSNGSVVCIRVSSDWKTLSWFGIQFSWISVKALSQKKESNLSLLIRCALQCSCKWEGLHWVGKLPLKSLSCTKSFPLSKKVGNCKDWFRQRGSFLKNSNEILNNNQVKAKYRNLTKAIKHPNKPHKSIHQCNRNS
jgi:hypothetical protein